MNLFELTKKQKQAFNRLKKAYSDCEKSGILFYNNYGALGAVRREYFNAYDDEDIRFSIPDECQNSRNEMKIVNEWADDSHFFQPTESAMKLIEDEAIQDAIEGFDL